jgi:hypothetical protein
MKYFLDIDISDFNPRNIPMTSEKLDIIKASLSVIDEFCLKYFEELKEGILCEDVLCIKPREFKSERTFQLALKDKCDRIRKRINGERPYIYQLKPKWSKLFETIEYKERTLENNDDAYFDEN